MGVDSETLHTGLVEKQKAFGTGMGLSYRWQRMKIICAIKKLGPLTGKGGRQFGPTMCRYWGTLGEFEPEARFSSNPFHNKGSLFPTIWF